MRRESIIEYDRHIPYYNWIYCRRCRNRVALIEDCIWIVPVFSKGMIFSRVFNVEVAEDVERNEQVVDGETLAHTYCVQCGMLLGWKFIAVPEPSMFIKEGRFYMRTRTLNSWNDIPLLHLLEEQDLDANEQNADQDGDVDEQVTNEQDVGANEQNADDQDGDVDEQVTNEQDVGANEQNADDQDGDVDEQVPNEQDVGANEQNADDQDGDANEQVPNEQDVGANEQNADDQDGDANEQVPNEQDVGANEQNADDQDGDANEQVPNEQDVGANEQNADDQDGDANEQVPNEQDLGANEQNADRDVDQHQLAEGEENIDQQIPDLNIDLNPDI